MQEYKKYEVHTKNNGNNNGSNENDAIIPNVADNNANGGDHDNSREDIDNKYNN